ncbi:helix-turn-helix domain-containing protein, partial [Amycolatopsis sp. NPDC049688]|uniref:helix-turn-helix domain-containing protein n=1 Tax=Amycolatopsis sp. NPDC049688 TaxID=3154733 RepID=UPI00343098BE
SPRIAEAAAMLTRGGPESPRIAEAAAMLTRDGPESPRIAEAAAMLTRDGLEGPRIAEAAAMPGRPGSQAALIAAAVAKFAGTGPQTPRIGEAAALVRPDAEAVRVEDPAASVAVSERRLRRRFVQAVGYGPATYLRVSRFQRAVALAPRTPGLAALAAAAGYADQAHLSRDCRALTGLTPRAYFRRPSTVDVAERDRLRSA